MISSSTIAQNIEIQKPLVRVRLTDGRTIFCFQVSAYEYVDGNAIRISGSTYYETHDGQQIPESNVVELLPFCDNSNSISVQALWHDPDEKIVYSIFDGSENKYYNLDGTDYLGDPNELHPAGHHEGGEELVLDVQPMCANGVSVFRVTFLGENNTTTTIWQDLAGGIIPAPTGEISIGACPIENHTCCSNDTMYEMTPAGCYRIIQRLSYIKRNGEYERVYYYDGVVYTPDLSSLSLEKPAPRYEDHSVRLSNGESWSLETYPHKVAAISVETKLPHWGDVLITNQAGSIVRTGHSIYKWDAEGDLCTGKFIVTPRGQQATALVGVLVRVDPLECPLPVAVNP